MFFLGIKKWWQRCQEFIRVRPLLSPHHDIVLLKKQRELHLPRFKQWRHFSRLLSRTEKRLLFFSLTTLFFGVIWTGWNLLGWFQVEVPKVGGRYAEAVIGSPQYINPVFAPLNDVDMDLSRLVYSGLLRYNDEQELVTDLAERYEISEDKKIYTFFLRPGVLWHDGEPFFASDVVFTIQTIQRVEANSPLIVSFNGVNVEAIDDLTVRFTLKEVFNPFLSSLTLGIIPEHIWLDIPAERMRLAERNLVPIGTGPFQGKKFVKDNTGYITRFELIRFPKFYRESAFIEEFVFYFFPDYEGDNGAISALREQRIDGLHFVPYDWREKVQRKHTVLQTLQLPQYTALFFNQKRQPFLEDSSVRLALTKAIDKERLVRDSLQGEAEVIQSPILPGFPGYNQSGEKIFYSVEQANALLDKTFNRVSQVDYQKERRAAIASTLREAQKATTGTLPLNENIDQQVETLLEKELNVAQTFYRKNKVGELIAIKLVTAETPEYRKAAEFITGFWQEIGIKTDIQYVSAKNISKDVLKNRDYDVLLYGIIIGNNPDQYPFWHSSQVDFPGLNLSGYVNRNVDELLEKVRATTNEPAVTELYQKFEKKIIEDQPAIFLYMPIYTYVTSDRVQGVRAKRIFVPSDRLAGVTSWYLETKKEWKRKNEIEK